MKKSNKKTLVLSVVAFVLILMSLVSFTYSWIDDIKLVEFQNDNLAQNGAPLKTGTDINATVNITKEDNTINLGNMLTNNDLTYEYTENGETKRHIRYDSSDDSRKPDMDDINEKKGYFYESGGMHLSPCYSDGETFYFPIQGQDGYREGNKDDENVNYISYTLKVSSPDANVDFWFDEIPTVKKHNTNIAIPNARFAINVDGELHVYSPSGTANTISESSTSSVTGVRKTSAYTFDNEENTTINRGQNSNTLFSIKKGETVNLNIKIWLEDQNDFDTSITSTDIDLNLVSSWAKTREIHIVDRTTTNSKKSWLNDDSATMFLTCPDVLTKYAQKCNLGSNVSSWQLIRSQQGYEYAPFYQLTKDTTLSTNDYNVYKVEIEMVYNTEDMMIYRCSASGWNTGSHRGSKGDTEDNISPAVYYTGDYDVTYWNWWKTTIPQTFDTAVYTLYGGSHDKYAGYVVDRNTDSKYRTYLGYGTWGAVEEISVDPNYHNVNWASYSANNNVYIRDYSDDKTSGETYVHSMYWNSTSNLWTAVIPKSSSLIQFLYTQDSVIKGCYGYNSYNKANPQMRPEGSVKYHFTFKNDKSGNVNGIGYWKGANHVFLIADGNFFGKTTLDSYIFYEYKHWDNNNASDIAWKNSDFPGTEMALINEKYQDRYEVYQSDELDNSNNKNMYPDRSKSNDGDNAWKITRDTNVVFNDGSSSTQTADLVVYPGCYYDPATNSWLGSLHGTGRSAINSEDSSGGSSGGTDESGGSMSGYDTSTDFVFKINGTSYTVKTNGTDYKVSIPLSPGDNWVTVLKGSTNFGNGSAGQYYNVRSGMDLYLSNAYNNNFSLRANTSGTYIASFRWENDNTIKVTSVLKSNS